MGITVSYQPDAQTVSDVAYQAGLGQYRERQQDAQRQAQQHQQDLAFQSQQHQQDQQADLQRMMLGAQIDQQKSAYDTQQQHAAKAQDYKLQNQYAQQNDERDLAARKQYAEYQAGLQRQADEQKMTASDRAEANRIQNDVAAIKADDKLGDDEKARLITAANIKDASLRQAVAQRTPKVPQRFPDLPPERQPGQPPWTMKDANGQPLLRADGSPVLAITNKDGIPEPWDDPIAKDQRTTAAKSAANQLRSQTEKADQFMRFTASALQHFVVEGPNGTKTLPPGAHEQIFELWNKMQQQMPQAPGQPQPGQGMQQPVPQGPAQQPSPSGPGAQRPAPSLPPRASTLMQQTGQQQIPTFHSPEEVAKSGLPAGTVFRNGDGKLMAVPQKRIIQQMGQHMVWRHDDSSPPPGPQVYFPAHDNGSPEQMPFRTDESED